MPEAQWTNGGKIGGKVRLFLALVILGGISTRARHPPLIRRMTLALFRSANSEPQTIQQIVNLILACDDACGAGVHLRAVEQAVARAFAARIRLRHVFQQHH